MPEARNDRPPVRIPAAKIALSTASMYPEPTASAFEVAAALGYDGVEVMVWTDPVSQDVEALRRLSDLHGVPVLAVHAPCLIITQRVWGADPMAKLVKAQRVAESLGAEVVVVHPPFRWQREYVRDLRGGIAAMESETAVKFAVENMFPLRARGRTVSPYAPDYHPFDDDYPHFTLDLSHASVSQDDAMAWYAELGARVAHVHLCDGDGGPRDEHLVPGRGGQPCAQLLEALALRGFAGVVVVEVNTRRAESRAEREADLAEALAYTRLHLAAPARPDPDATRAEPDIPVEVAKTEPRTD